MCLITKQKKVIRPMLFFSALTGKKHSRNLNCQCLRFQPVACVATMDICIKAFSACSIKSVGSYFSNHVDKMRIFIKENTQNTRLKSA